MELTSDHNGIDWERLRLDLVDDDFHNGRTTRQLRLSFENSALAVYAIEGDSCIGTARALSDGVCNAYVVDVWTQSKFRRRGIGAAMMNTLIEAFSGQHIYLFTDDAVDFYKGLGFTERPVGLEIVSGNWLENSTR